MLLLLVAVPVLLVLAAVLAVLLFIVLRETRLFTQELEQYALEIEDETQADGIPGPARRYRVLAAIAARFEVLRTQLRDRQRKIDANRRKRRAAMTRLFEAQQQEQRMREALERERAREQLHLSDYSTHNADTMQGLQSQLSGMGRVLEDTIGFSDQMYRLFSELDSRINGLTDSFGKIAMVTGEAGNMVMNTAADVDATGERVDRMSESMRDIGTIISSIDDISEQTRLLSVNASIEAARAGAAGAGFRVVAAEVKQLAETTAKSSDVAFSQLADLREVSAQAVESMGRVAQVIARIRDIHRTIDERVGAEFTLVSEIDRTVKVAGEEVRKLRSGMENLQAVAEQISLALNRSQDSLSRVLQSHASERNDEAEELTELVTL